MSKDLYVEYMKEREGVLFIYKPNIGFLQYTLVNDECFIQEVYVTPEHRNTKIATQLANEVEIIAKEKGCTFLTCTVDPRANGSTASVAVILKTGFQLHSARENLLVFIRSIK